MDPHPNCDSFLKQVAGIEKKIRENTALSAEEQVLYFTHLVRLKPTRRDQAYADE